MFAWLFVDSGGWSRFLLSISSLLKSSCFQSSGNEWKNYWSISGGKLIFWATTFGWSIFWTFAMLLGPDGRGWFWTCESPPNGLGIGLRSCALGCGLNSNPPTFEVWDLFIWLSPAFMPRIRLSISAANEDKRWLSIASLHLETWLTDPAVRGFWVSRITGGDILSLFSLAGLLTFRGLVGWLDNNEWSSFTYVWFARTYTWELFEDTPSFCSTTLLSSCRILDYKVKLLWFVLAVFEKLRYP